VERREINWGINFTVVCWVLVVERRVYIYLSFSTKVMEFPYSLVWNDTWNFDFDNYN